MRTALAFLTRLPVPPPPDPDLSRAAWSFPLVGLLVGAAAAGTRAAADQVLPPLPATILAIAVAVLLTGALHEDGLADVADATGAHVDRARRLEILKDPRVGAFGATALILALALTATSLAALDTTEAVKALIVAHVLSRWAILPVGLLQPAKPGGAGGLLRVGRPGLAVATLLAAAAAVLAGAAVALAAAALTAAAAALFLHRTLGGITGDGYGATAKLTEVVVCVTLVAFWG
ncbi:adenosylcobinamide-GDP ribazoletransferase [Solirubrobacter sp. CPCC 204708]|uniref:Adenosylcobinamide-GDP ribazoletransferase n=1 Tax=Solirubrobacter deserti TaxID=2282478 RepID=A0ABT4RE13_9ACTN|nr:adenosylcobinamide-GDP ribazoletransferase [Solirubrobacter deserti]MBE2316019.1 adenosylcobinamide-GDP ribazoletransferase [Solirubrobacter deserti]MDA0136771.1 adenosylcobinamide-GDP ribazoletransferase [Solirubrobacter deserti]